MPALISTASIASKIDPDRTLRLTFAGRLDSRTTGAAWRRVSGLLWRSRAKHVVVDASRLEYCDSSGLALFVDLQRRQRRRGRELEIDGLRPEIAAMLEPFSPEKFPPPPRTHPAHKRFLDELGRATVEFFGDVRALIMFVGELCAALASVARRPRELRLQDALSVAEKAGVNALPIVALIGVMIGLIMAFQSAIPLKRFGAQLYVSDLVAISTLRELGPLLTAVVLAGRSGSAFAAEIGTMKINEELDALVTMGLEPVRFLIVPRVLAAIVMMPLLTLFFDLCALAGSAVVVLSLGFPLAAYTRQVFQAVDLVDLAGGLFKAFVFGVLVAAIGCLRGLQTANGASSVGASTTRAVVSGIVMIVVADCVFAVLYNRLGI